MRSLDLLFLTQTYPRFDDDTSGPFIRDLARGLVAGGDRVKVLTPHAEGVRAAWDDGGVGVESFRYAPEKWELLGYSRSLDKDEKIRLAAGAVAPLYAWRARRALRRALASRAYDLVHAHWVVPNALVARSEGRRVPLAVGLHGSDVFLAEKPLVRRLTAAALARTTLLTGCSPELVDRVCALGFPRQRSRVIPYGVSTDTFFPGRETDAAAEWRRQLGVPADAVMMLTVGRMVTKKGYQVLVEVLPELLRRHSQAHMVFGGTGDRLAEFRQKTSECDGRVHFPGLLLRDKLPDLYRAADLFVLPAVHDRQGNVDGLPNVILEAMASGLPIVASAISGIPLAVESERNGLLVDERQREPLFAALDRLLSDASARRAMGEHSRRRAVDEFTWAAIAERYRTAYHEALGSR